LRQAFVLAQRTPARQENVDARFEEIYLQFERPIHLFVYQMLSNQQDAEDVTQETFLRAYRSLRGQPPAKCRKARLYRIATNACLDAVRRKRGIQWTPWESQTHDHNLIASQRDEPEAAATTRETRDDVRAILLKMSGRGRASLLMREVEGMNCEEIGAALGVSRSAAKSTLCRAREEFRSLHRQRHGENELIRLSSPVPPAVSPR
jgi:RNA polymerase sigma-70 factor (ECF subfamily)